MLPVIEFNFEYDCFGQTRTTSYATSVDTPVFMVQTELEVAGYEGLKFIGYEWPSWAWPGGYPLYYVCKDGGILCPKCANDNIELTTHPDAASDWRLVEVDINYEYRDLYCDHCDQRIESAYAEDEADPGDMDGDFDSAMASAGHGTDEDYGG